MARIEYVDEEAIPEVAFIFDQQRHTGRSITNFHRLLARVPWVYKWYLPFSQAAYRGGGVSTLDQRTRQLVQIKTSLVNECAYCTSHNSLIGQFAGVQPAEMEALRGEIPAETVFSDRDLAVIEWAASVADNSARRNMAGFERLQSHFTETEIAELTVLAAVRTMVNRIQEALWTDLEAEEELGKIKVTVPGSIDDYVRDVLCPVHRMDFAGSTDTSA